ncbi:hypothetical protein DYU05_16820 [Mucilaginibacter terrenus]|uniref:Uncharacterized protein n=1 Tax=Mucilaginibacter terrenus TaxID=2482727 RepID=A0A3E2NMP8_9SPHI|nr:hypothetical protein [Mucilaginibacter terrenus]RFZ82276.1 hypothetical protein DYU05_16820 [Mucilaginibacter terrenus]
MDALLQISRYKGWLFGIVMLIAVSAFSKPSAKLDDTPDYNLHTIRKLLVSALESKKTTDSLYKSLVAIKGPSSLVTGYIGTLEAIKAKHAWNPYLKIKYLNNSERTFKTAIGNDPHNIEIRFMRFSIEHNVPGFLGYNKNLTADRQEIIHQLNKSNYAAADKPLVKTIIRFLLDSKRCTTAEQHQLTQHLAAL